MMMKSLEPILSLSSAFLCIFIALLSSGLGRAFRDSLFQVVALGTSSGFASADYMAWPAFTSSFCSYSLFLEHVQVQHLVV